MKFTLFTSKQIEALKKAYGQLERIDPASSTYQHLMQFLSGLDQKVLRQIATEEVKFLSVLARGRLEVIREMREASLSQL